MIKSSRSELSTSLTLFSETFIKVHQQKYQCLPKLEHDHEWRSPCEQGTVGNDGFIEWQPVGITDELTFTNIEAALELTLHASIKEYFTCFYSESIPAQCDEGYLELLFAWSEEDFARLQQNIIGHVLMKRKLKQTQTIFFAVTDDDNVIVSLDNQTGEVYAEKVGKNPHKKLADSLTDFINGLTVSLPNE